MADLEPALIGFIGALVGSATSLVGVYLNQRAQERRTDREFHRSTLLKRLERQERALDVFRAASVESLIKGDYSKVNLDAVAVVATTFGPKLARDCDAVLFEAWHGRTPQQSREGCVQLLLRMRTEIDDTYEELGLPRLHWKAGEPFADVAEREREMLTPPPSSKE